jgi:hypothetical protein
MAKPSATELQQAASGVDVENFAYEITLKTSAGPGIRLTLDPQKAPRHVRNMVALAESGFYDNGRFHRVIKSFMIQGGCPEGSGRGGPGYEIDAEFNDTPPRAGRAIDGPHQRPELCRQLPYEYPPLPTSPLLTALPDQPQTDEYQRQPTGCGEQ